MGTRTAARDDATAPAHEFGKLSPLRVVGNVSSHGVNVSLWGGDAEMAGKATPTKQHLAFILGFWVLNSTSVPSMRLTVFAQGVWR